MSIHKRKRLHWHPNVLHFVGILILFMLSVGSIAVVDSAARSTEVSLEQALEDYRATPGRAPSPVADPGPVPPPAPDTADPEERAPLPDGPDPAAASAQAQAQAEGAPHEQTARPAAPAATAFRPPATGVYRYRGTGGESVNMPGAARTYPRESLATVRLLDGCGWEFEHQVAEEHVDQREYCSQDGELLFRGGETRVAFFGQSDGSRITCDPPAVVVRTDDQPGAAHGATCQGEGTRTDETMTFIGREDLVVGGVPVRAYHLRMEATISGRAEGTSRSKMWLHPDSGLLLRVERQTDTTTNAFGGRVRYQEHATFELVSLEPAS